MDLEVQQSIISREARVTNITSYRSIYNEAEDVRKLALIAAHSVVTHENKYNYTLQAEEHVETRLTLDEIRKNPRVVQ